MNDGDEKPGARGNDRAPPEAVYARYADERHARARARTAAARVVASLREMRDGAPADASAAIEPFPDGSPEALYRRYREVRPADDVAVAAPTVDAIMGALRADAALAPASEPTLESTASSEPDRGSALGALFRWPGAALDRALGALGDAVRGVGAPKLVPAMALAAVAVAVVPFVLRDAADPAPGTGAVAFVPASLLEADGLPASAYAPDASAGVGFAGGDPLARGYRTGIALTDLVLASRGDAGARTLALGALRFESGADDGAIVSDAVDALGALAVPTASPGALGGAADAVRDALAGGDPDVAERVDLGRAVEAVRAAATLADERGATTPLAEALDALASRARPGDLPARAAASLDELAALAARPALEPADAVDALRAVDRLRLLLG